MQESKALAREASAASMASDMRTEARAVFPSQAEHVSKHARLRSPSREVCETRLCNSQLSHQLSLLQASAASAASVSTEVWTGLATAPGRLAGCAANPIYTSAPILSSRRLAGANHQPARTPVWCMCLGELTDPTCTLYTPELRGCSSHKPLQPLYPKSQS